MRAFRDRAAKLTDASISRVERAINGGDVHSARWWLERIGIEAIAKAVFDAHANPELRPEDLDAIIETLAEAQVDEHFRQQGTSAIDRLRTRAALTAAAIDKLKKESQANDPAKCSPDQD